MERRLGAIEGWGWDCGQLGNEEDATKNKAQRGNVEHCGQRSCTHECSDDARSAATVQIRHPVRR